jgi:hypothetical protein
MRTRIHLACSIIFFTSTRYCQISKIGDDLKISKKIFLTVAQNNLEKIFTCFFLIRFERCKTKTMPCVQDFAYILRALRNSNCVPTAVPKVRFKNAIFYFFSLRFSDRLLFTPTVCVLCFEKDFKFYCLIEHSYFRFVSLESLLVF